MIVRFFDRTFGDAKNRPQVHFNVIRYSRTALGGCQTAEIQAFGDERALWQLLYFVRYGVEIQTDKGLVVWWGYVHDVEISLDAIVYGQSMERFANRIAVAYSYSAPGSNTSSRSTTPWAQDENSIAEYGYKEAMLTLNDATQAQAEAHRANALAARANPLPKVNLGDKSKGINARLICKGWSETLGWRFYSNVADQQVVAFETEPENVTYDLGNAGANTYVAQSFTFTGPATRYTPTLVRLKWVKIGNPNDSVIIDICSDNAGNPGTTLASISVPGASLPTEHTWVDIPFDTQAGLTSGATYWIQIRRSGTFDSTNFYRFAAQSAGGYAQGQIKIWNGSSWVSSTGDLLFKVVVGETRETSAQISEIASATGQFISGIDIETPSGIYSNPARDGNSSGLQYIDELIASGTSTGKRCLWEVTRERRLRVYLEPEMAFPSHIIRRDGTLLTSTMQPVMPELTTVGVWVKTTGMPSNVDDPPFFIESAEYDAKSKTVTLKAREVETGFDAFKIGMG